MTFSVLKDNILKRISTTAQTLWKFLENILDGDNIYNAFNKTGIKVSTSSIYRLYKKMISGQNHIRTLLLQKYPPPDININKPLLQTILHLKKTFDSKKCPVEAFQFTFQTNFF
jgi:hypothetical protein